MYFTQTKSNNTCIVLSKAVICSLCESTGVAGAERRVSFRQEVHIHYQVLFDLYRLSLNLRSKIYSKSSQGEKKKQLIANKEMTQRSN